MVKSVSILESIYNADNYIENIDAEVLLELTPTNLTTAEPGLSHVISGLRTQKECYYCK